MESFGSIREKGINIVILTLIAINLLVIAILNLDIITSYELFSLLKIALLSFDLYQIYYIGIFFTVKYTFDSDNFYIISWFGLKKVKIPIEYVEGYCITKDKIKSVHLSGHGKYNFSIGKAVVDKIGTATMYVTCNKNIFYIKTKDRIFGVSPEDYGKFEQKLNVLGIKQTQWEYKVKKNISLYKDRYFMIPFIIVSVIILIQTIMPAILYVYNMLPANMPLSFDALFNPVKMGTAKQFVFKQMTYGVLNMAILFCMYYASYFYAKYDKRLAYKYIYVSLIVAAVFLLIQFKILSVYNVF